MRASACVVILAVSAVQLCCGPGTGRLIFDAKVSDLRKPGNALANHKRADDTVEIALPGRLLTPPMTIQPIDRAASDWSTPEHAVATIISANLSGNPSWMVENYLPPERDQTVQLLSGPLAVERTRDYYRNLGKIEMYGWADLHGLRVVFLRGVDPDGDVTLLTLTLSKTASGWKQTNALAQDDTFDLVWTALHTDGVH